MVLCYSPDRLARKFAYQALLIEEFTRAGTRVEFVKGPRGDTPGGSAAGAVPGHVRRVREGADPGTLPARQDPPRPDRVDQRALRRPVRLPLRPQDPHAGAAYEIIEHEAALVAELFRRYADDGASIADLARWLTEPGVPTRTGKHRWDRIVIWGMLRNPAYAGTAVFGKTMVVHESAGPEPGRPAAGPVHPTRAPRPSTGPARSGPRSRCRRSSAEDTFARVAQRLADNKRFASRNSQDPLAAAGPGRLRGLRLRLLPHLAPAPPTRRSTTTGAWAPTTTATKPAGSAPTSRSAPTTSTPSSGTTSPRCSPTPR